MFLFSTVWQTCFGLAWPSNLHQKDPDHCWSTFRILTKWQSNIASQQNSDPCQASVWLAQEIHYLGQFSMYSRIPW